MADRRGFLKSLGAGLAAIAIAPAVIVRAPKARTHAAPFATPWRVALYTDGTRRRRYSTEGEVVGPGYARGGMPVHVTVRQVGDGDVFFELPDHMVWSNASFTARAMLLYGTAMPEWWQGVWYDFGGSFSVTSGNFTIYRPSA